LKIGILGAGAWGSALAIAFSARHAVTLWSRCPEDCASLERTRRSAYLPDCRLPDNVQIAPELAAMVRSAELVVVATSADGLRPVLEAVAAAGSGAALLWACKGFERDSRRLAHEIAAAALPRAERVGALSGPSFALEVARGLPTALVLASRNAAFAEEAVAALNTPRLRIYSSSDVIGVELGGAVKNVIAIAAGICDGLALGRNARAALITRGLTEIARLGVALGGHAETFMGLAGLGDLVLTCTGELSRNREVGLRLARGEALEGILAALGHVAEGVRSTPAALDCARELGVDLPITAAVHAVLFEGAPALAAVERLLARDPRAE